MIRRWERGRAEVDHLIDEKKVEWVPASRDTADAHLAAARRHIGTAETIVEHDPELSVTISYDASRKALTAILDNQGLRATSRGGHLALIEVLRGQLVPPLGGEISDFDQLRRMRNQSEYAATEITEEDAAWALDVARRLLDLPGRLLDQMPVY